MKTTQDSLELLLKEAQKAGATAADAILVQKTALTVGCRLKAIEHFERVESSTLGLRVLMGRRQAIVSTSDTRPESLGLLAKQAIAMAKIVPEDPHTGLAPSDLLCINPPNIDNFDKDQPTPEHLIATAKTCEETALSEKGITNSQGAEASWSHRHITLATSTGFHQSYRDSLHSLTVSVLAEANGAMEGDYESMKAVYAADLESPESIGRRAAERTLKRLNPRKVASTRVPVVFDPRVAKSLLEHFVQAISGPLVARGTTFLKDSLGKQLFPSSLTIVDDPLRPHGLRSRPFDGEGLICRRQELITKGVLNTWLLDVRSAHQLNLTPTGHASRSPSTLPIPSPSNLYFEAGTISPKTLIKDVKQGFYVTQLMGTGVNLVTGDYSRGATGFWIENGEITYPVSEVTIAGNLKEMFSQITAADDLSFRYGIDAPTLLIESMMVAGR